MLAVTITYRVSIVVVADYTPHNLCGVYAYVT